MSSAKRVAVIGAGFSGLTLALRLRQQGLQVSVFEADTRVGGLIQTDPQPVMVEMAAHALLASQDVEELFRELDLAWVQAGHRSKSKWIFRHSRARRWPLQAGETFQLFCSFVKAKFAGTLKVKRQESLAQWADRNSFSQFKSWLLGPALQGVYGSSPEHLSASLILGSMTNKSLRLRKGKLKGSVAPQKGMQALLERLAEAFKQQGGDIHLGTNVELSKLQNDFDAVVVATSMKAAAKVLQSAAPNLSKQLQALPMVSLVTSTVAYPSPSDRVKGFGCLFTRSEDFSALGVLFNTDLFADRGPQESETWIFPGTVAEKTDQQICELIQKDRQRISKTAVEFSFFKIIRWPDVLPLYGPELEAFLESDLLQKSKNEVPDCLQSFAQGVKVSESVRPLYLTGNYLGGIGLTKILGYNNRLAQTIQRDL